MVSFGVEKHPKIPPISLALRTNTIRHPNKCSKLKNDAICGLGCEGAGPRIAAIISVIETCRRLQIRPRDYFDAILPGLADFPVNCVTELTPTVWVQTRL